MRAGDCVRLDASASIVRTDDPYALIAEMATGRSVLNVGAAGNARSYRSNGSEIWLHRRLAERAARMVGIDIDEAEIEASRALGYDILSGNCETVTLDERFDLIVLSDVIEHLDNVGTALANLVAHLKPRGRLAITTPNATYIGNLAKALIRRPPSVYWDHVATYSPEHVQALCDRQNYRMETVAFFTLPDRRTAALRLKSRVLATLGAFSPRMHGAFLCIIDPANAEPRS